MWTHTIIIIQIINVAPISNIILNNGISVSKSSEAAINIIIDTKINRFKMIDIGPHINE